MDKVAMTLTITKTTSEGSEVKDSSFSAYTDDHNLLQCAMVNAIPGRFNWKLQGYKYDKATGATLALAMFAKKDGAVYEAVAEVIA